METFYARTEEDYGDYVAWGSPRCPNVFYLSYTTRAKTIEEALENIVKKVERKALIGLKECTIRMFTSPYSDFVRVPKLERILGRKELRSGIKVKDYKGSKKFCVVMYESGTGGWDSYGNKHLLYIRTKNPREALIVAWELFGKRDSYRNYTVSIYHNKEEYREGKKPIREERKFRTKSDACDNPDCPHC